MRYRAVICLSALTAASFALPASASWLDDDALCRQYGCVVVHDGVDYYVYDFFDQATGKLVPKGARLLQRAGNPIQGGGPLVPVITGSLTPGTTQDPGPGQGTMLGISNTQGGAMDITPSGDTNGFLDAEESLAAFEVTEDRSIVAADTRSRRSFYISSYAPFELSAQVRLTSGLTSAQDFYDQSRFKYRVRRNGTDDGMRFGRQGDGKYKKVGKFKTLGDLTGGTSIIGEFRNAIRKGNASTIAEQSVRFDYDYSINSYDMSLGAGELSYQIEFDFFRP